MNYSKGLIKGRWPEAEEIIIANPKAAVNYAQAFIKDSWPEAEDSIKTDSLQWGKYKRMCKKYKRIRGNIAAKKTKAEEGND